VSRGSLRDPSQNLPPLNRSLCPRFTVGESWLESGRSGEMRGDYGEIRGDRWLHRRRELAQATARRPRHLSRRAGWPSGSRRATDSSARLRSRCSGPRGHATGLSGWRRR
uniref:Uncharacterized protein n=2 Tax=Emiliania huxleyi TaxID=2903 RepID=A0A0D3IN28_EMIH1